MTTDIGKALGERIKLFREAKGMTQAQLAAALGKSVETVSNFERGKTIPSVLTLHQVSAKLGIAMKQLFDDLPVKAENDGKSANAMRVENAAGVLPEDDLEILAGVARVLEGRRR